MLLRVGTKQLYMCHHVCPPLLPAGSSALSAFKTFSEGGWRNDGGVPVTFCLLSSQCTCSTNKLSLRLLTEMPATENGHLTPNPAPEESRVCLRPSPRNAATVVLTPSNPTAEELPGSAALT